MRYSSTPQHHRSSTEPQRNVVQIFPLWFCVVSVTSVVVLGPAVEARDYLVNQAYETLKRGDVEVELYNDMNFAEADNAGTYNSKHQVELEYGLTNRFQLSYYEVYTWNRPQDWERDAFKIEAKYRFAEAGKWPLDVALYTEYENPNGPRQAHSDVLENKLILSKTIGRFAAVANVVFEKPLNNGEPWAYEYTAGASFALTPRTRLGLEVKQGLGDSKEFHFDSTEPLYLIPTITFKPTKHVEVIAGPAFGLTRVSDDLQLRSIVEVEF